jgi:predicted HicB family RNase H-like nuclease
MTGIMTYKGYTARLEFDSEAKVFHGEVLHLRDVITFEGTSVEELEEEFKNSIEDYLEWCAERGEEPDKPYSGQFLVRATPDIHRQVVTCAAKRGISLNSYVVEVLEEKLAR